MCFSKKILAGAAAVLISFSSFAASGTVAKVILEGLSTESRAALSKMGLREGAQSELLRSLEIAVTGLNKGAKLASEEALRKLFSGNDDLLKILAKDFDKISDRELAKLNNTLADQANRLKAGSAYIACSSCVDAELSKLGITVLAREAGASTGKILSEAPRGAALQKDILARVRSLKIPGVSQESIAKLSDTEKAQLFVALKKTSGGSKTEQGLGKAIQKFSTSSGDSYLEPKIWLLLSEDLGEQDMERMATLLNRISTEEPASGSKRVQNLRQWFESNADTPELKEALDNLKAKNCWGIF